MLLLKLLLTPLLTLAVSLAARIWGHRVSGWLTALPIVAGPIMAVLMLEQGAAFAIDVAIGTLITLPALAAYIVAFGYLAQRSGWLTCLLVAWAAPALSGEIRSPNTFTVYSGRISAEETWHDVLLKPYSTNYTDSYLVAASFTHAWQERVEGALRLESEVNVAYNFGEQDHWELNIAPLGLRALERAAVASAESRCTPRAIGP